MPKAYEPVTKICVACGASFTVRRKRELNQRYCSTDCRHTHEGEFGREAARVESTIFQCKTCGNDFSMKPSYVRAYQKKFGKLPLYCSRQCSYTGIKDDNAKTQIFQCEHCGKTFPRRQYSATGRVKYYSQQRYCSYECKVSAQMARAADKFNAGDIGKHIKRNGYVWISIPANIAGGKKREMLEHRWIMEQYLSRRLFTEETVHHIDGNRQNNAIGNLELFSSRHGPGQRVVDKIAFAIEMLTLYPEFVSDEQRNTLMKVLGDHQRDPPFS